MIVPKAPHAGPEPSRPKRSDAARAICALFLTASAACSAGESGASRFPLSDRGPFNALIGIPDGWTERDGPQAELSWHIANNAMGDQAGPESLLLDGETHTVTLRLQRGFGERLSLGLALPWIAHSGGFLDSLIDRWHEAFGLSDGIRPELPGDDLRFVYARDGTERFRLDQGTSGIGDLRSSAALRVAGGGNGPRLDLTADVDWPTGDADRLTGSGGTDVAAGLRLAGAPGPPVRWAVGAGILWPGDVDLPLPAPAGRLLYYDAALSWTAIPALDLLIQLQGHGAGYQSDVRMLGDEALQLGAGALWRLTPRYSLRFGVFEDIRTDTMPDFAMEMALLARPGRASAPRPDRGE